MITLLSLAFAEEAEFPSSPPIGIDDAETVEKGHAEINVTLGFSGTREEWETELPLVDANYGLTDNIHVNAEIPWVVTGEGTGLGRGAAAVKLRVLHRERVSLALHPAVEFPPIPKVSLESAGSVSFTLPVVLDVAVGDHGGGLGIQCSHTFAADGDGWGAAVGFATPLADGHVLMVDYTQEATAALELEEGWFEVGYVQEGLFNNPHLTLLSALGRSTQGRSSAMVGVQLGF